MQDLYSEITGNRRAHGIIVKDNHDRSYMSQMRKLNMRYKIERIGDTSADDSYCTLWCNFRRSKHKHNRRLKQ